jgi:hypothetical protein
MNNNKSILDAINSSLVNINWDSNKHKELAIDLCISIYNLYIYDGGDFYKYRQLSYSFFLKIIKTSRYVYVIKNILINSGILESNNKYDVFKGKAKGYRFNSEIINGNYTLHQSSTNLIPSTNPPPISISNSFKSLSNNSTNLLNHISLYHICSTKVEPFIINTLERLKFDEKVFDYIDNFTLTIKDIIINEDINDEFVDVIFDDDKYRYSIENALKQSKLDRLDLIKYNDKCYIDDVNNFIIRKTNDLKLIFKKNVFDIENKLFRCSRNETNMRLDYNLTNMKSELLDFILIDGEKLVEIDIANSQFSILSYIIDNIDNDFIENSRNGKLYDTISKKEMFRVCFDKIRNDEAQNKARELYPMTMEFIDKFKSENGYKMLSNLLQRTESKIIIDYIMDKIIDMNIITLPIHDAFRVKESEYKQIKNIINGLFDDINFKCLLRNKKEEKIESIKVKYKYKGYKDVELEITQEDKELFKEKVNGNKSLLVLEELNFMEIEKLTYLWNIYIDKNKIYRDETSN